MEWWLLLLQIMIINLVLSGDNAVVIALASRGLPYNQPRKAIRIGATGAILLRILLTLLAVFLLKIPFLQIVGALLLLWIAVNLIGGKDDSMHKPSSRNLMKAVWTIIVADFVMSLDNVLAVASKANQDYLLLILGLTVIIQLLNQFPFLI